MVTILIILLTALAIAAIRGERQRRNKMEIQQHYLEILLLGNSQSERYTEELSHLSGSRAKRAAAEVVAELRPIIYRIDPQMLDNISQSLHLSDFLVQQACNSRGLKLISNLTLLSKVPIAGSLSAKIAPLLDSKDRMVRFLALLTSINAEKDQTLHHIAKYPTTLTTFEISQLLSMLRQGSIAVAYQPMLWSESLNLNLLAMAVIKHFSIESAEQELRQIVDSHKEYHLRREALYTLASMQLTLYTVPIAQFVKRMPRLERQQLLRYVANEGYSQSVVNLFGSQHERQQLHSLINSYKIKIECF